MKSGIGIDIGTFHTVATSATQEMSVRIPRQSVPSIALRVGRSNIPIVGIDAIDQLKSNLPFELILAPKLKLDGGGTRDGILQSVLRKLADQAIRNLGGQKISNVVMTVPPGWTLEHCQLLREAVEPIDGIQARFIHEPIALLIATMYLAPKYLGDTKLIAKLENAGSFLVCDWGAGTVDIALVKISKQGSRYEFSCVGELTDIGHGGTALARDIVREHAEKNNVSVDIDKLAFHLQSNWQGEKYAALDFSDYEKFTKERRLLAAKSICKRVENLFNTLEITNRTDILCILHGGPIESLELRSFLQDELVKSLDFPAKQFLHIGNEFTKSLPSEQVPWRRDVLVATGASLFAACGNVFPEFEYEIALRDSFGTVSSRISLAIRHNLKGIQVISPPFTGVDYYVDVRQVRRSNGTKTSVKAELSVHVRPNAVLMYQLKEAGVGYVLVQVTEAQNLVVPKPFDDALSDQVCLPERSTRFSIELE